VAECQDPKYRVTPDKIRRLQRALYATAKQSPARRFHLLYDKVSRDDILAHADALSRANGGAPGVDGETYADIEEAGRERWLGELREEARTGRYRPQPLRRVRIPKASGVGQRPLGIPTIRYRVVQVAAVLVLEPIFEADFDEAAYGYRPKRSALDAVRKVSRAIDEGRTEVLGRRPVEVLRHDSALRVDDERRAPYQRRPDVAADQAVAETRPWSCTRRRHPSRGGGRPSARSGRRAFSLSDCEVLGEDSARSEPRGLQVVAEHEHLPRSVT